MNAQAIIALHGASNIKDMLRTAPELTAMVAISRYRLGVIFYRVDGAGYLADYQTGKGWQETRYRHGDIKQLHEDLQVISFIPCDLQLLKLQLELEAADGKRILDGFSQLEQQIISHVEKIEMRQDSNLENDSYWKGQKEAFEICKHMIRNTKEQVLTK